MVEDYLDTAATLRLLLTKWGFDVRVACDGPSALEVAQTYWPQVVLLDIGLPGMDGWQVAARMREEPSTKNALLLAVTAYGQETDIQRSLAVGFHDHMVKPINPLQLKTILDHLSGNPPASLRETNH